MSLSNELEKLQQLHDAGALTAEEFVRAKARVLASETAPLDEPLRQIQWQNELARLDREWELEREHYMITGKHGTRYVPQAGQSLLGGVIAVVFGIFWTAMASSMTTHSSFGSPSSGPPRFLPLFGVLFIVLGAGAAIHGVRKGTEYEQAHRRYQQRRADLLEGEKR